uniref:Oxysterol-binding protein n=1 Tax=Echeneis naucrates TaxID=173247 RepID=A0A665XD08_ECHNA
VLQTCTRQLVNFEETCQLVFPHYSSCSTENELLPPRLPFSPIPKTSLINSYPNISNLSFPLKVPQIFILSLGAVMSEPKTPTPTPAGDTYKGWVFKWTNYIKGYQRRWFVLSNGLLSYYRTQAEMGHTCRGTINLATATITVDDACNFVISNGGAQTYHLKASCEVERQRWITALELAKAKAARMQPESDDSGDDFPPSSAPVAPGQGGGSQNSEVQSALRTLGSKVEDLSTCNDLISKHGSALQRSLSELDSLRLTGEAGDKIRQVTERATLFRITSNAMINVSIMAPLRMSISLYAKVTVISSFKLNEEPLAMNQESPSQELVPLKTRRTRIPDKPNYSLNLWSIMKNCIGKELSKIPMPVNFNEPISMLQRLSEDLEYHELLDKAAKCQSSLEQMCYVAAFSVSSYSTTVYRTGKPFNPLLGETFELDRRRESGYRSLCEQVSHHPPAAAHHVISDRGWTLRQEITVASKFRGKYLSIMPLGTIHAIFEKGNNHYTWKKVTTTVHNIIVGKLWIDQSGEIDVVNHTTGDRCHLKFAPYSYFSRDVARKVTGVVMDKDGKAHYVLSGTWDEKMEFSRVMQSSRGGENGTEGKQKTVYQTLKAREVWRRNPLPDGAETMYYFTALALTLNEPEEGVAPTDSRRRPDQRLMEDGRWDEANAEKQRLEEKQRSARREREREAASQRTSSQSEEGKSSAPHDTYQALWFEPCDDRITGEQVHIYKGGYWEAKDRGSWEGCPDIF